MRSNLLQNCQMGNKEIDRNFAEPQVKNVMAL